MRKWPGIGDLGRGQPSALTREPSGSLEGGGADLQCSVVRQEPLSVPRHLDRDGDSDCVSVIMSLETEVLYVENDNKKG